MKIRNTAFGSAIALACASIANAAPVYNTIQAAPGGEQDVSSILGILFGGTFNTVGGPGSLNLGNGSITAQRIADSNVGGPMSLTASVGTLSTSDGQIWSGSQVGFEVKAKYAGDNSVFGWRDDTNGGFFSAVSNTGSIGNSGSFNVSSSFRWALQDLSTGREFTSRVSDNVEGGNAYGQLVTYRLTGAGFSTPTWALFWEDRIAGGADYDYNDSVIVISAMIPAPGSVATGALGLILAARRRRR
ncbi:MAG: hypothetical protein JNM86_10805 [Phycisphaerae bacterium]|nr:hypothetical protein [Phycisphaerae bacterium]MBN8598635.1 hypothetical protein [Planctomycetota bacterium]